MEQGKCFICKSTVSNGSISGHIRKCVTERYGISPASDEVPEQSTYLIEVQDKFQKEFYLYLLVDSNIQLCELDRYLRDIWLDCCDHQSSFLIDGVEYKSQDSEWSYKKGLDLVIGEAFKRDSDVTYTYDFGSSTVLSLKVVEIYEEMEPVKGIRLAGRNIMENKPCKFCSNEAVSIYENRENGDRGIVCKKCMRKMKKNEAFVFWDLVNSPRAGVCEYKGNAGDILFLRHRKTQKELEKDGTSRFIEEIISGNISPETKAELDRIMKDIMQMEYPASNSLPPYVVNGTKLNGENLPGLLELLNKNELDYIRKSHGIEKTSNIRKDELIREVHALLVDNPEDILAYMPTMEYMALMGFMEAEDIYTDSAEEIPEHIHMLRRMGLIYSVQYKKGSIKWVIPEEIKFAVRRFTSDKEFSKKRELTERLESAIICIFFYWGIATKSDIMKEASLLLEMPMNDEFEKHFDRVFIYMKNSYIETEVVGKTVFHHMFSGDLSQKVKSEIWQNAKYPDIPKEAVIHEKNGGWLEFALQNPYISLLYDIFNVIEGDEAEEDFDEESTIDFLSILTHRIFNARPGTTVEQLVEEIGLSDELRQSREFISLLNNLLLHSPNYWMKGNAVSGVVHFKPEIEFENSRKVSGKNGQKAIERAAERWKVGINDPCPCGSGKKYKHCCM